MSVSRNRALIVAFCVLLSVIIAPQPAKSSTPQEPTSPRILASCKDGADIPCIKEVRASIEGGPIQEARLTGRTAGPDREFVGNGYEEYEITGAVFEGSSKNRFIPRFVFYPYFSGNSCAPTNYCLSGREFVAAGVQPSWLNRNLENPTENQLNLPHRKTNLLCGSKEKRDVCYRSNNFNVNIKFYFDVQLPSTFVPIWASGSAKEVEFSNWKRQALKDENFYLLSFDFASLAREMVLFSDYYENPIDAINASQYADYPADWPGMWIHGSRDRSIDLLDSCRTTPFMSVMTNGIYQEVPKWNAAEQSIDLKLYAPHLKVDGGLNRGFYELRISQELAKCFWNIEISSNTRARVVIVYPERGNEVLIETVSMNFSKSILSVVATNFTFSSPTIKTQLFLKSQEGSSSSAGAGESTSSEKTPNADTEPKSTLMNSASPGVKRVTITCTKGKLSKKISAVNPKCPKGFKRKR